MSIINIKKVIFNYLSNTNNNVKTIESIDIVCQEFLERVDAMCIDYKVHELVHTVIFTEKKIKKHLILYKINEVIKKVD